MISEFVKKGCVFMRPKLTAVLTTILLIMLTTTVFAAIPGDISEGKYIKAYVRSTQNVPAYRDSSLRTRGNSRGAYNAAVYPTDEIRIYQMNGSVAYIGYIAGKNWVKAYIATSAITSNNSSIDGQRFSSGIGRGSVFARPNGTVYSGSAIDAGDTVWKLAEENGYTQVVYPAGSVYKMAWIRTGDYNSRVSNNGGRVVPTPAPNPVVQPVSRPATDTYVSPAEAKPGDLVFFQGTYDTAGASHCAIYVGNGMMIHCGNPIQYTSMQSSYWQQHFYCFGRLP